MDSTSALLLTLRQHGIVDSSRCRRCLEARAERERLEAQQFLAATRTSQGKNWSSMSAERMVATVRSRMEKGATMISGNASPLSSTLSGTLTSTSALPPPVVTASGMMSRPLHRDDCLLNLSGSMAMLELDDDAAEQLLEKAIDGMDRETSASCTSCRGSGRDRVRAHFSYSEEAEFHSLHEPGRSAPDPLSTLSPQAVALRSQLMQERGLDSLIARKIEVQKNARINSMNSGPGKSTILIRKQNNASSTPVLNATKMQRPKRDKKWLYAQFEELRFPPSSSSASTPSTSGSDESSSPALSTSLPPLTSLHPDLMYFTRLHTLHVSRHQLRKLTNLPASIRVVHAAANQIEEVELDQRQPPSSSSPSAPSSILPSINDKFSSSAVAAPSSSPSNSRTIIACAPVDSGVRRGTPPRPPPPIVCFHPHLTHLFLAFNRLRNLDGIRCLRERLHTLDVAGNELSDLGLVVAQLSGFRALKVLHTNLNPIALHKYYRAAILSAFIRDDEKDGPDAQKRDHYEEEKQNSDHEKDGSAQASASARALRLPSYTLDMLDGHASHAHLTQLATMLNQRLGLRTTMSSAAAAVGATDTARTAASSSSSRLLTAAPSEPASQPSSSPGTVRKPATAATGATSSTNTTVGRKSKKAQQEAALAAEEAARRRLELEQLAQAEAKRVQAEEEARQALASLTPTHDMLQETPRLLIVISGRLRGIPSPSEAFERNYGPLINGANSTDESSTTGGTKKKKGGGGGGSDKDKTSSSSSQGGSATATSNSKRRSGKLDDLTSSSSMPSTGIMPSPGWLATESRSEALPSDENAMTDPTITTRTLIQQRVRYYFTIRVPPSKDGNTLSNSPQLQEVEVDWQDGSSVDTRSNASGVRNEGNGQGNAEEIIRTVEYEWEQMMGASNTSANSGGDLSSGAAAAGSTPPMATTTPPVHPSLTGAPCTLPNASAGINFAKELIIDLSNAPSWRDFLCTLGLELLLYEKVELKKDIETTTSTPAPLPVTPDGDPASAQPSGRAGSASRGNKKDQDKEMKKPASSSNKKGKKAPIVPVAPPTISVATKSAYEIHHRLLASAHVDTSSLLAVRPRHALTTFAIEKRDLQLRRPGPRPIEVGSSSSSGSGSDSGFASEASYEEAKNAGAIKIDLANRWLPEQEWRLPIEQQSSSASTDSNATATATATAMKHHLSSALKMAKDEGINVLPSLVQPPPPPPPHATTTAAAREGDPASSVTPAADHPIRSRGGGGRGGDRVSEKERERLEREKAAAKEQARQFAETQARDPTFILDTFRLYLNTRPMNGVGSVAFKTPASEEEIAAMYQAATAAQTQATTQAAGATSAPEKGAAGRRGRKALNADA